MIKELSIIKRVKNLKDVFSIYKPTDEEQILLDYNGANEKMVASKSFLTAAIIAEVLNEGPELTSEYGWLPYYRFPGFGFSGSVFGYRGTYTLVGSRLCLNTEELSDHAGKTFTEIYIPLLTNKKH